MTWTRCRCPCALARNGRLSRAQGAPALNRIPTHIKQFAGFATSRTAMDSTLLRDASIALCRKVSVSGQLCCRDHRFLKLEENLAEGRLILKQEVRQLRRPINLSSSRPHPIRVMGSDLDTLHKTASRRVRQTFIPRTCHVVGRDRRRYIDQGITQCITPSICTILAISLLTRRVRLLRQPQRLTRTPQGQHIERSRGHQRRDTHPRRCVHEADATRGTRHPSASEGWGGTPTEPTRPPGRHRACLSV